MSFHVYNNFYFYKHTYACKHAYFDDAFSVYECTNICLEIRQYSRCISEMVQICSNLNPDIKHMYDKRPILYFNGIAINAHVK